MWGDDTVELWLEFLYGSGEMPGVSLLCSWMLWHFSLLPWMTAQIVLLIRLLQDEMGRTDVPDTIWGNEWAEFVRIKLGTIFWHNLLWESKSCKYNSKCFDCWSTGGRIHWNYFLPLIVGTNYNQEHFVEVWSSEIYMESLPWFWWPLPGVKLCCWWDLLTSWAFACFFPQSADQIRASRHKCVQLISFWQRLSDHYGFRLGLAHETVLGRQCWYQAWWCFEQWQFQSPIVERF